MSNPSLAGQLAAELKAAILQLRKALAETCGMDTMIVLHAQAQSPRYASKWESVSHVLLDSREATHVLWVFSIR